MAESEDEIQLPKGAKLIPADTSASEGGVQLPKGAKLISEPEPVKKKVSSGDSSAGSLTGRSNPLTSISALGESQSLPYSPIVSEDERAKKLKEEAAAVAAVPGFEVNTNPFNKSFTTSNFANDYLEQQRIKNARQEEYQKKQQSQKEALAAFASNPGVTPEILAQLSKAAKEPAQTTDDIGGHGWIYNHILIPFEQAANEINKIPVAAVDVVSDIGKATENLPMALPPIIPDGVRKYLDDIVKDKYPNRATDNNIGEDVVEGVSGVIPMIMTLPVAIEEQAALNGTKLVDMVFNKAGRMATSPIVKQFALKGAAEGYNTSSSEGNDVGTNTMNALYGAKEKAIEGIELEAQMLVGGAFGKKVANAMAEKGFLVGGKPTEALINSLAIGTVFGGTPAAKSIINGDPINWRDVTTQFAIGAAFGIPEVAKEVNEIRGNKKINQDVVKAGTMARNIEEVNNQAIVNNLIGFDPLTIKAINENPVTADQLYTQSLETGMEAYEQTDPQTKRELHAKQISLKNQGDIKRATEQIVKNPSEFLDGVFQSDLPVQEKVDLMNKVTQINNDYNPIEIHKQNISKQINDIDGQVKLIDAQQQAAGEDAPSKAQAFQIKNDLVTQRTALQLSLTDLSRRQETGESPQVAMSAIEANRAKDLSEVGPLNHNVIENKADGTFDVVSNGEIISQYDLVEEAQQRADDLNRPQLKRIDEINNKYNQQINPFNEAIGRGVIEPPTGKTILDSVPQESAPETVFNIDTPVGKIIVEPIDEATLSVKTPDGEVKDYSVVDAIEAFDIKPEDVQKIAKDYVKQNPEEANTSRVEESNAERPSGEEADIENEIPSEAVDQQKEVEATGGELGDTQSITFKTSKGSEYTVNKDGSTIRNKAPRSDIGHEGDFGIKEPSSKTYYITPENANILGEIQAYNQNKRTINNNENGQIGIQYISGADQGKVEKRTIVPYELSPKIGLIPVEVFPDSKVHFGNKITEVLDSSSSKPIQSRAQELANTIRGFKTQKRTYESILGIPVAIYDGALETVATAIETGEHIVKAIKAGAAYIKQNTELTGDKEIEDALRNSLLQKPTRNENEPYHDYASRVLGWKKSLNDNTELSTSFKNQVRKSAQPESSFNSRVKNGTDLLKKNIVLPLAEYNKSLGLPEGDIEHYVASIKNLIEESGPKRVNAERILTTLREQNPKKVLGTEAGLLKRSLRERERASREGYRTAKEETKQAFLEYDAAKKTENKEKIADLKNKYESKLQAQKTAGKEQAQKLKDSHNYIRESLHNILTGLNDSKLLSGVKYAAKDVLGLAGNLNKVISERGIDSFKNYVGKLIDKADYSRDIEAAKENLSGLKSLMGKDYVPQNIKGAIREFTQLNPNRVEDVKQYNKIASDILKSQTMQEFPQNTIAEINRYTDKEIVQDLKNRKSEILDKHDDIRNSKEYSDVVQTGNSGLAHRATISDMADKILGSDKLSDKEKISELNKLDEALSTYRNDLEKAAEEGRQPTSFLNILDSVTNEEPGEVSEEIRHSLEDAASATQDAIDPLDPDLSTEQSENLRILQQVPLEGLDSNTLRLFNNVVNNIVDNNDTSGMRIFKIKAEANGEKGAKGLIDYIKNDKLTGVREAKTGEINRQTKSFNTIVRRIANSSTDFATKILTHTGYHDYKVGSAKVKNEIERLYNRPLYDLVKKYPDLLMDTHNYAALTQFARLMQHRETAISEEAQSKEMRTAIKAINDDIKIKSGANEAEQVEAQIAKESWDKFQEKILTETGVDIYNQEDLKNLNYSDVAKIDNFLTDGQQEWYDLSRKTADEIKPELQKIHKELLNKEFEGFVNYLPNNTRTLNSPFSDAIEGENGIFRYNSAETSTLNPSSSSFQRVKGNPVSEKSRVINYDFKNSTEQAFKEQLHDINTLEHRMFIDETMRNPELRETITPANHDLFKQAAAYSIKNDMGLGEGLKEEWRRKMAGALGVVQQIAAQKQLFTADAIIRQYVSAWVNTLRYTGLNFGLMKQMMESVYNNKDLNALIDSQPISERPENFASFNVKPSEQFADKKNTLEVRDEPIDTSTKVGQVKAATKAAYDGATNFLTKFFLWHDRNGIKSESPITKSLKFGDVAAAKVAWAAQYADYMVKHGKLEKHSDIDWSKELASPNKEAAAYAEHVTSIQLNENTKSSRPEFIQSKDLAQQTAKSLFLSFGSFNLHKGQNMAESMRTLFSKETYLNKDYRKNEASDAVNNIMSSMAEEFAFQGAKFGLRSLIYAPLSYGIAAGIHSLWGTEEEKNLALANLDAKEQARNEGASKQYFNNTVGNYFFGGLGSLPQKKAEQFTNWLLHQAGVKDDLFVLPNEDINKQIHDTSNYGYYGAAFQGDADIARDVYRLFDNTNKYGVPVNYTAAEKAKIVMALVTEALTAAGRFDPNINRIFQGFRQQIDYDKSGQFHEPYYRDEAAPRPMTIIGEKVILSDEHQNFYQQKIGTIKEQLLKNGVPEARASQLAAGQAKAAMLKQFGYDKVIKSGTKIKKKK